MGKESIFDEENISQCKKKAIFLFSSVPTDDWEEKLICSLGSQRYAEESKNIAIVFLFINEFWIILAFERSQNISQLYM